MSEWIHCWGVPKAPGCSFPRRYMCTLEDKILDWKMPPVTGRNLHPGQLVCRCAMSGLMPQLSQFATVESQHSERICRAVWERRGEDPVGIHVARGSAVGRKVGQSLVPVIPTSPPLPGQYLCPPSNLTVVCEGWKRMDCVAASRLCNILIIAYSPSVATPWSLFIHSLKDC